MKGLLWTASHVQREAVLLPRVTLVQSGTLCIFTPEDSLMQFTSLEVGEVLGALAQSSLSANRTESKHSKTSVQHFSGLHTENVSVALVLEELKRVKAKVSGVAIKFSLGNLDKCSTRAELDEANSHEQKCHGSLSNEDIVGIVGVGDVINRVDASWESHHDSESTIGSQPSEPGKHGNTSVLELGLAHPVKGVDTLGFFPRRRLDEPGKVLRDRRQVEGVKSNITRRGSIKSLGTGQPGKRGGSLGGVNHLVPHAVRHAGQGCGTLTSGRGGESHGRTGHHCENGSSEGVHGDYRVSRFKIRKMIPLGMKGTQEGWAGPVFLRRHYCVFLRMILGIYLPTSR